MRRGRGCEREKHMGKLALGESQKEERSGEDSQNPYLRGWYQGGRKDMKHVKRRGRGKK